MNSENNKFSQIELEAINQADDLKIAPLRQDGVTYGTPTWIWEVVVNGDLYVRAYNGPSSRWYQSAIKQKAGQIHTIGKVIDVLFEATTDTISDQIDAAYRTKYNNSPYVNAMISERARQATIKITPKS